MKKRLIAFLLVLIMVLGMLPVSAFAVDGDAAMYTYHLIHEFNYVGGSRWDIQATTAAESYQIDVNKRELTRNGYTFLGWADKADATGAQYHGGELITLTKDNPTKTIYAVWEKNDSPVPDNPGGTKPDVAKAQVKICVQCIEDSATHQPKNYDILPGAYVDGLLQVDGTYYYSITLNRAKYIEKFGQDSDKTHTDTEPNESIQFKWQWKNGKWELISDIAPVIKVKCDTTTKPASPR